MGTRGPYPLVDTTPAKTILVFRNGDQFYVGRKFVFSRRHVANFEALLEQLTAQVDVPFGVRRLYTPTRGHQVRELDALQTGGKYVAAGRERFKKLDYIHIVPRRPSKMRKLKEIKPVVHSDMNVPSRWQSYHRLSRHINVFTNGRLFIPPIKIIIPKFSLTDWNSVLATIGEKVFPLGGVRKLFTMDGRLLDNSKDLQDNNFYIATGLEAFKNLPYWRSPNVPSEVQRKYADTEKYLQKKKKVTAKAKEPPPKDEDVPPKTQESVYYAKQGKKKLPHPPVQSGAGDTQGGLRWNSPSKTAGDVYKAQNPTKDTQGAPDVKEDQHVKVEVPVDQVPAEVVKEEEEAQSVPDLDESQEKEDESLFEDIERKGDSSRLSFKKRFPLRHNTKKKASFKNFNKNKKVAPFPEKEQYAILEEKNTPVLLEIPVEIEAQREQQMGQEPQKELSPRQEEPTPEQQESSEESPLRQPSQEGTPEKHESSEQLPLGHPSQEPTPEKQESSEESPLGQPSQETIPEKQESSEESPLGQPSQETIPEKQESSEESSLRQPSQEPTSEKDESSEQLPLGQPSQEPTPEKHEASEESSLGQPFQEGIPEKQESSEESSLGQPSQETIPEKQESSEETSLRQPSQEPTSEQDESSEQLPLGQPSQEPTPEKQEASEQLPLGQPYQEPTPEKQESSEDTSSGQSSQELTPEQDEGSEKPHL